MSINKLSSSNKIEPMQASHPHKYDVDANDAIHDAQISPRGRGHFPKDLSTIIDAPESLNDPRPLKIKLTVPPGFRKRAMEPPYSSTSHRPNAISAIKKGRPRKIKSTNGEGDDYAPPRGYKPSRSTVTKLHASSAPPRQPHDHRIQVHHPPPDHATPRFPVFVPASVLSSDDLSGSDDSELTDEETDEDEYPEETLVINQQAIHDRARTHRELLGNDDNEIPTRAPWKYNRHTNSKRATPTASNAMEEADDARSSGNEQDGEEDDEEDEDDEADAETPMQIDAYSDDEDDEKLDAQLFFNNLLAESSGSEDEDAQSDRDSVMGDIVVDAAGSDTDTDVEVGQFGQPLMVKEGWNGELVFSTEILPPPGLMDFNVEPDLSQLEDASQTESLANSLSTLPVMQPAMISDDGEEFEEVLSEAGDTTDDEIMPSSLISLPFAPTIAPQATFTPHRRTQTLQSLSSSLPSPSPADVLAGIIHAPWETVASPVQSIAFTDEPPPRSRSASAHSLGSSLRGPRLGFFNGAGFGNKKTIIGDTPGKLPSPFSVLTPPAPTLRRKRTRANSDLGSFFTKRSKNSSALASSYFLDDLIAPQQGQLVDLDDLLDASLLSDDFEKPLEPLSSQDGGLSRWDRIPMNVWRQTRDIIPAAHDSSMSFSFAIGGFPPPPLPTAEFGSPTRSHVSHGSIDSILWEDEIMSPAELRRASHHPHGHHGKRRHRDHDFEESHLPSSSRASTSRGDRTPTQPRSMSLEMTSDFLSEAKSRKDKRKEKKRERASLQKHILSALDETLAEGYEELVNGEDIAP